MNHWREIKRPPGQRRLMDRSTEGALFSDAPKWKKRPGWFWVDVRVGWRPTRDPFSGEL